jgi:hypothetical protein
VNRALSAVFNYGNEFSSRNPVDAMWIQWKLGLGILLHDQIATDSHRLEWGFYTAANPFRVRCPQFCSEFPLFRCAYYYYWFYMFLI